MSERAEAACEVTGAVLLVVGVALIYVPLAFVLSGVGLMVLGNLPKTGRR